MTTNTTSIFRQGTLNNSNDKITETLSKYTEKKLNKDKSITYTEIPTTYFLDNNKWHIDFFGEIEQFKEQVEKYKYTNKNIYFQNHFTPHISLPILLLMVHLLSKISRQI